MVALQSLLSYLPESFVSSEITLKNNLISIKENYGRNETTQNQHCHLLSGSPMPLIMNINS